MLFGADYITLFRGEEMQLLSSALTSAAMAYVASNLREVLGVVPPRALAQLGMQMLRSRLAAGPWRLLVGVCVFAVVLVFVAPMFLHAMAVAAAVIAHRSSNGLTLLEQTTLGLR